MAGVGVEEFWRLTPWQTAAAVKAQGEVLRLEQQRRAWHAWHTGVIAKMGTKVPPLERFMGVRGKSNWQADKARLLSLVKTHNERLKKRKGA
jgi:hypothetical protein